MDSRHSLFAAHAHRFFFCRNRHFLMAWSSTFENSTPFVDMGFVLIQKKYKSKKIGAMILQTGTLHYKITPSPATGTKLVPILGNGQTITFPHPLISYHKDKQKHKILTCRSFSVCSASSLCCSSRLWLVKFELGSSWAFGPPVTKKCWPLHSVSICLNESSKDDHKRGMASELEKLLPDFSTIRCSQTKMNTTGGQK